MKGPCGFSPPPRLPPPARAGLCPQDKGSPGLPDPGQHFGAVAFHGSPSFHKAPDCFLRRSASPRERFCLLQRGGGKGEGGFILFYFFFNFFFRELLCPATGTALVPVTSWLPFVAGSSLAPIARHGSVPWGGGCCAWDPFSRGDTGPGGCPQGWD